MSSESPLDDPGLPGEHTCSCHCGDGFRADSIPALASKVARHHNREHSSDLRHQYDVFDRKEIGGDHIRGNVYQVRRLEYRVTTYDVLAVGRGQPLDEAFGTPEDPRCCTNCWRYTGTSEVEAVELDSADVWGCEWRCEFCHDGTTDEERPDYEKEAELSRSLDEFAGGGEA